MIVAEIGINSLYRDWRQMCWGAMQLLIRSKIILNVCVDYHPSLRNGQPFPQANGDLLQ